MDNVTDTNKALNLAVEPTDSVFNKIGREAYVFGGGTIGGALKETYTAVTEHPKDTAVKLAQAVGVGAVLEASQFGPPPVKLAGFAVAGGLGISFYSDMLDKNRWNRLGNALTDTWLSNKNTDRNFEIVQKGLGHLAFDTALMVGGAKVGSKLGTVGVEGAMSVTGFGKLSTQAVLPELSVAHSPLLAEVREGAAGTFDSRVINPADTFNHAGYKFVQAKAAAVAARIYDGNSIGYSCDGQNRIIGDADGNLRHMRVRRYASPEEVANLVMAGGYTELVKSDALAHDAARQAAIDSKTWPTAQARWEHASKGSVDYISGKDGNAYTQYLKSRFGSYNAEDGVWAQHILTDATSPESPWNPRYVPATKSLFDSGLPITQAGRAAATNAHVLELPAWQRRSAIEGVARYLGDLTDTHFNEACPMVRAAVMGRLAPEISNSEVDAAMVINSESQGRDVNTDTVRSVARLVDSGILPDAAQAYRALRASRETSLMRSPMQVSVSMTPAVAVEAAGTEVVGNIDIPGFEGDSSRHGVVSVVATSANRRADFGSPAANLLVEMHDAGFSNDQLMDPATVKLASRTETPGLLRAAAIAGRVLGSPELTIEAAQTVEAMMNAGWNEKDISRMAINISSAILRSNGYPSPDRVSQMWSHEQQYIPRAGAQIRDLTRDN